MPLAVIIGMSIVTGIYMLANCAYFTVLDFSRMLESNTVANRFASATMGKFSFLIPFFICILMIGAINATIFSASRFLYAASKRGFLPIFISVMNVENESPRAALAFHSILVVIINFFGNVDELINYCVFAQWSIRSITMLILFYLRFKSGIVANENVVRMPILIPIIFYLTCSSLIIFALVKTFELAAITVFVFIATMIIYYLFFWKRLLSDFDGFRIVDYYLTILMQFILNGTSFQIQQTNVVGTSRVAPIEMNENRI